MYLIEFFGAKVKPRITRGKGMWKPLETGWLNEDILAIRDKDVNCFLIRGTDGFIAIDSEVVFPNAQVYLSREEQKYLTGEYFRKKIAFYQCKLPIKLSSKAEAIDFGDRLRIDGVEIEAVAAVGHTLGHTAYLISNKYFFTGDCLIVGKNGGYCFYDFWNADSKKISTLLKRWSDFAARETSARSSPRIREW